MSGGVQTAKWFYRYWHQTQPIGLFWHYQRTTMFSSQATWADWLYLNLILCRHYDDHTEFHIEISSSISKREKRQDNVFDDQCRQFAYGQRRTPHAHTTDAVHLQSNQQSKSVHPTNKAQHGRHKPDNNQKVQIVVLFFFVSIISYSKPSFLAFVWKKATRQAATGQSLAQHANDTVFDQKKNKASNQTERFRYDWHIWQAFCFSIRLDQLLPIEEAKFAPNHTQPSICMISSSVPCASINYINTPTQPNYSSNSQSLTTATPLNVVNLQKQLKFDDSPSVLFAAASTSINPIYDSSNLKSVYAFDLRREHPSCPQQLLLLLFTHNFQILSISAAFKA